MTAFADILTQMFSNYDPMKPSAVDNAGLEKISKNSRWMHCANNKNSLTIYSEPLLQPRTKHADA